MSRFNKFAWESQAKNHNVVQYCRPIAKEKVAPSEKVTQSEEVEKGTNFLDDVDNTKFIEKQDLPVCND